MLNERLCKRIRTGRFRKILLVDAPAWLAADLEKWPLSVHYSLSKLSRRASMSDNNTATTRKRGRPRKTPGAPPVMDGNPGVASRKRVLHAHDVRREKLGNCSNDTLDRLNKHDPDFPAPFALHGRYERYWLEEAIDEYLVLKAKRAQAAKQAKLAARAAQAVKKAEFEEAANAA
jgi:hypothetical protein